MIPLSKNRQNRIARIISLSGTCGFIVLSVIQVPRLAVHTGKLRSQQARQEEFAANLPPSDSADEILEQLNATNIELNKVKASMIDGSQLPKLQSELLEIARDSGCRIRKVAIQTGSKETWKPSGSEEQLVSENIPDVAGDEAGESYSLNIEQIDLSLSGTFEQIDSFLATVRRKPWMMRITGLNIAHSLDENAVLNVDGTLKFLKLSTTAKKTELVEWREGLRPSDVH